MNQDEWVRGVLSEQPPAALNWLDELPASVVGIAESLPFRPAVPPESLPASATAAVSEEGASCACPAVPPSPLSETGGHAPAGTSSV